MNDTCGIKIVCKGQAIRIRECDKAIVAELRNQKYDEATIANVLAILQKSN